LAGLLADDFVALRALFSTRNGQPTEDYLYDQSSVRTKALLDAYTVGVNKWIDDMKAGVNGAKFPREFEHPALEYSPEAVPPWTPQDSVATILALAEFLTNDETRQAGAGLAREEIQDDEKFVDLWGPRPLEDSAILPLDWMPPSPSRAAQKLRVPPMLARPTIRERRNVRPALENLNAKLDRLESLRAMILGPRASADEVGSNNWVVGPSLTTNGRALLSNDPHLGMTQPPYWYLVNLDAKTNGSGDIHAAGITFAGLPWVLIGQNETIAWGATTANTDNSDVYIETLTADGSGVVFEGEDVPFTRGNFTLVFSDGTTEDREFLIVPQHGPVRELDVDNGTAITLRWTGSDIDTDINFFPDLAVASNLEEARQAITNSTTIGQNWVVVDSENNIGWYPYQRIPKRLWANNDLSTDGVPWLPLDGGGDYEWGDFDEYYKLEELPQATNPDAGYIATANNDMTGALFDGDPTTLPSGAFQPPYQVNVAVGFRHARIVELIEQIGDQHSRATMDQIISDVHSLIGERMVEKMLEIATDDQTSPGVNGLKIISALQSWDLQCPTGLQGPYSDTALSTDSGELVSSSGCTAFHALFIELRARIEANENAPGERAPSFAMYNSVVNPDLLAVAPDRKDIYWDDPKTPEVETKFEVMSDALQAAGEFLDGELGSDETQWAWGRLHGLQLSSDLASFGIFAYDNPTPNQPLFANDGGLFTVDVANTGRTDFVQTAGPSMRFVCEASPSGPSCTIQLPGGQSSDIESPFYEDLLFPYLANEPMPLVFDIAEAAANAEQTINFQ
jgi:penicillin amidase